MVLALVVEAGEGLLDLFFHVSGEALRDLFRGLRLSLGLLLRFLSLGLRDLDLLSLLLSLGLLDLLYLGLLDLLLRFLSLLLSR